MYSQIDANKRRTAILIAVFGVFLIAVGYAWSAWSGSDPTTTVGIAIIISVAMSLFSYYSGDKVALTASGARAITKEENPYAYRLVENVCIAAGLKPVPKVYIIEDPAINAFACGRDPLHASIAITTGAIQNLENEELEGVIAHEVSHIMNYDVRVMTLVVVLVGAIALLAQMARFGGGRRRSNNDGGGVLAIIGLIFILLSPLIAQLIQLAISRKREYLADASGALLTRYPEGLARALEKIEAHNQPMARANSATAHLFFDSPYRRVGKKISGLFSTHPPIEERIAELRAMTK